MNKKLIPLLILLILAGCSSDPKFYTYRTIDTAFLPHPGEIWRVEQADSEDVRIDSVHGIRDVWYKTLDGSKYPRGVCWLPEFLERSRKVGEVKSVMDSTNFIYQTHGLYITESSGESYTVTHYYTKKQLDSAYKSGYARGIMAAQGMKVIVDPGLNDNYDSIQRIEELRELYDRGDSTKLHF